MEDRDNLVLIVSSALALAGVLLVFLPLFANRLARVPSPTETARLRRFRNRLLWAVPALIILAAVDATLGLLALWGSCGAGTVAAWLLLVLVWLLAVLSVIVVSVERM